MRPRTGQVLTQPLGPRALASAALLVAGAVFVNGGLGQPPSFQYFTWSMGFGFALLAWRLWNTRVVLGQDLIIQNVLRTIRLDWSEVERFELDRHGAVRVRRRDTRRHRVTAFGRPSSRDPLGWRENNQGAVVALQAALEARRA